MALAASECPASKNTLVRGRCSGPNATSNRQLCLHALFLTCSVPAVISYAYSCCLMPKIYENITTNPSEPTYRLFTNNPHIEAPV
jgi:hypothetical protein